MRRLVSGMALAGLLAGGVGLALAQGKPPAAGGGKPGAAAPAPAPPPAATGDKFGAPPPAAAPAPPPAADKFASPPPAALPAPATPAPAPPVAGLPGEPEALARLRALLGPQVQLRYRSLAPVDPATGAVRLSGVKLDNEIEIEELTLDRVAEDRIDEAVALGVTLRFPNATAIIGRVQLGGFRFHRPAAGVAPVPGDFGMDLLRMEGLAVQGEAPASIGELAVEDWAAGRPGRLTLTGLDLLTPTAGIVDRVRLGRIALRGYDLPELVAAMVARRPPTAPANEVSVEIDDVVAALAGRSLGSLASFRLGAEAPAGDVAGGAQSGRLALRGLTLSGLPVLAPWLQRFGYSELSADLTLEARVDPAAERLDLTSFAIAARGMGGLGLSLQLEGLSSDPQQMAANAERVRLAGATLRYVDQSLYGRWVADQARQHRLPEAQLREQYASMAAVAVNQAGPAAAALAPALAAVQRFLRGQAQELEVTLKPPSPVRLGEMQALGLQGPAALQRQLGLGVVAR